MPYTPILATLGYILSPDGQRVLLIHRNARPDDPALGKYNGLGGKLEVNEDVAAGMCREIQEESGLEVSAMSLRGTVSWPGFGKKGEDWFGFIFVITEWSNTPLTANEEGVLEWIAVEDLLALRVNLWPGDKYFLPLVFDGDPRLFHGVMPYANGQPMDWQFTRI
jgi:8-oxo-dGTP diphosphatase